MEKKPFIQSKYIFFLVMIVTCQQILPLGDGMFWGSEGDWYTQHVAIAETLRKAMLESGKLIPQWISLGAGSSIYDFSYYGVLRLDVIISCIFPNVEMKYFIAGYALVGIYASGILGYFWLKRNQIPEKFSFLGAVLLVSAGCFYHAHHQIMFVNYMPFLILSLWGVQRILEKNRSDLLIFAVSLICLHSFYYAPACLVVIGIYSLYYAKKHKELLCARKILKWLLAVSTSIGISMVLLLPTGINILATTKDAGSFGKEASQAVNIGLEGLLYTPYGCGMTILALYCLLIAVCQRKNRFLAAVILGCMVIPAVSLVLNGFLYARAKILIPFLPLVVLVCADTLWRLKEKEYSHSMIMVFVCLIPALCSEWNVLIYIDVLILIIWIIFQKKAFYLCMVMPIGVCLGINLGDANPEVYTKLGIPMAENQYVSEKDGRKEMFDGLEQMEFHELYRTEILVSSLSHCNLASTNVQRTTMYSSITNNEYAEFFYDTMKNPISYNNRVALTVSKNPYFSYFMGIRYFLTTKANIPEGYEVLEEVGDYVLVENPEVLPVCYGTSNLLSEEDFEQLQFPDIIEALCRYTVVENAEKEDFISHFKVSSLEALKDETKLRILQFDVESTNGEQVIISINKIKNKLSGEDAPYPNRNSTFTYVIDEGEKLDEKSATKRQENCEIKGERVFQIDKKYLKKEDIVIPTVTSQSEEADYVFAGKIEMEKAGYFVTSFPYKEGYSVWVDEKKIEPEIVNTAFLGFPISEGLHEIEIRYVAPGYEVGRNFTIFFWMVYIGILVVEYKENKGGRKGCIKEIK